jgi:hypothetical protein
MTMSRKARIFCFLVLAIAVLSGCSSQPSTKEAKKAAPLHKIQGKAQVLVESSNATDSALNAGGSSVYLWEGAQRYRLFLRSAAEIVHGNEYVAEGIFAQKVIDELGDPDQGRNGYPLQASCERVVTMAWTGLPFDGIDAQAAVLRARINRYPARPIFLVTRIRPATEADKPSSSAKKDAAEAKNIPEISVPPEKQRALLVEGSQTQPAPLWEPAGGTVKCKVIIDTDGKVSEMESGTQLCENVTWSDFRYQPTTKGGRPAKVKTEVEMRFEPRK